MDVGISRFTVVAGVCFLPGATGLAAAAGIDGRTGVSLPAGFGCFALVFGACALTGATGLVDGTAVGGVSAPFPDDAAVAGFDTLAAAMVLGASGDGTVFSLPGAALESAVLCAVACFGRAE